MATCGYVCPLCEGRGVDEHGADCQYCKPLLDINNNLSKPVSEEEWIKLFTKESAVATTNIVITWKSAKISLEHCIKK